MDTPNLLNHRIALYEITEPDRAKANALSDRLFEQGVFAQAIAFPTVARDRARVRTIVTATHTRDDLQYALDMFAKVGRELDLV